MKESLLQAYRLILIFLAASFLCSSSQIFSQSTKARVGSTERKIKRLKLEMQDLQKELKALEELELDASQEFVKFESNLKSKMFSGHASIT